MPAPKKLLNNSSNSNRIGIDCRLAGVENSGIGRYVTELVRQIILMDQQSTFVLFCLSQKQADLLCDGLSLNRVELVINDISHYSWKEQVLMPLLFYRANLDLLHVPHFNVPLINWAPLVVTIHDLLWHQYRGTHVTTLSPGVYLVKYLFYKLVVGHAIMTARKILVPSNTIVKTIQQFYPQVGAKIKVTYEGVAKLPPPQKVAQTLPANYLLYVGNLYPHKNVAIVLHALTSLPKYHLVICGSRDAFSQQVLDQAQQLGVSSQVTHLGKVSDAQLAYLYQSAFALVQPSRSEGFGLTGLEAMSQHCPVIASRIPIFQEIYQDGAEFFAADSAAELVTAVQKLTTKTVRQEMMNRQNKLITQYSWLNLGKQTLQVYYSVLSQT